MSFESLDRSDQRQPVTLTIALGVKVISKCRNWIFTVSKQALVDTARSK